jgi:cellulose synthase (UDP-forming)
VIGAAFAVLPLCTPDDNRVRSVLFALSVVLGWRYIHWRWSSTLPPAGLTFEAIVGFAFVLIETMVMAGSTLSSLIMSRTLSRTAEADSNAGWWGTTPPQVDVLIATYNEESEILERTITGAIGIRYPHKRVWVLDDGGRDWLRELCAAREVGYLRRPDNSHAKAGNINNALRHLETLDPPPEFVAVFDADFVAYDNFVSRALSLFHDPEVGLVQTPQHFFNADPIQTNLSIGQAYPDEQRFFFDHLLASRDAWGIAFCCGTSSMIRWAGLQAIGGIPTNSVTEDFLVTLRLKEHGWRSVYLNERLSDGLAPEGLKEYVTQRGRWCLGFMQIMRGPLGPLKRNSLTLMDRLGLIDSFMYWSATYPFRLACVLIPSLYWWFGVSAVNASIDEIFTYFLPYFLATMIALNWTTKGKIVPVLHDVGQILTMFEIIQAAAVGLLRPRDQKFRVTAKGGDRHAKFIQWAMLRRFGAIAAFTILGMVYSCLSDYAPSPGEGTTVVMFWTFYNLTVLALAMIVCIELPRFEQDEIYETSEEVQIKIGKDVVPARLLNISAVGARVQGLCPVNAGTDLVLCLDGVGDLRTAVSAVEYDAFEVSFLCDDAQQQLMVRKLHSSAYRLGTTKVSLKGLLAWIIHDAR